MSDAHTRRRRRVDAIFVGLCIIACCVSVFCLGWLLVSIAMQGWGRIDGIRTSVIAGDAFVFSGPDGETVVPLDGLTEVDQLLHIQAMVDLDGEQVETEFDVRRSELVRKDGTTYAIDSWGDSIPITDDDITSEIPLYGYTPPEGQPLLIPGPAVAAAESRGFWRRLAEGSEFVQFLSGVPSRRADKAGMWPALAGSIVICIVCAFSALPLGVGTAVFLEEFKPSHPVARWFHGVIEMNIRNLAGVPSIVYGIIGLTAFVQFFGIPGISNAAEPFFTIGDTSDWYYVQLPFGRGAISGGLTLMLVVLPIVIISSQEALRAVPGSLREGALAMGSTKWQMVWNMTLPASIPGIMTGAILAISRAIGEAAPILVIAGIVYITWAPKNLMDEFTAMPLQIFNWAGRPQEDFHATAAAGIMVLLVVLLSLNGAAILIRHKFEKKMK